MTTELSGLPWEDLEQAHAAHGAWRRIHPRSTQDLRLQISPGTHRRRLVLGLPVGWYPGDVEESTGGVAVFVEPDGDASRLVVELRDVQLASVFDGLVTDIADHVAAEQGPEDAVRSLSGRFGLWVNLLRHLAGGGLDEYEKLGLYGELTVLADLVGIVGQIPAVNSWTGPSRANQDFQLDTLAVEVKTTSAKNPQTLLIANERELDAAGVAVLVLVRLSVDQRRGGDGKSLAGTVADLRSLLTEPAALAAFDLRLATSGYVEGPQYEEPRYSLRRRDVWHVRDDFPRIVEQDLRDGVGDVTYRVVTSGLDPYRTELARSLGLDVEA